MTNVISASSYSADITGPDFIAAPMSSNQPSLEYQGNSNWTITFSSPVTGLRLYARWWRMYTYIFDHEFTILSGSGFTTNEDTLFVSDTWGNGIIEFQDTLTELTLTTDQICCANQALNFGLAPPCANTTNTIDTTTCGSYISPSTKYTWELSDTYTDTILNSSGCDSIITINLTIDCSTILENNFGETFQVYPNPAINDVIIDLGQEYHKVTLKIYSITSQKISVNHFESANSLNCELVGSKGLYFIEISTNEGKRATVKVLKN